MTKIGSSPEKTLSKKVELSKTRLLRRCSVFFLWTPDFCHSIYTLDNFAIHNFVSLDSFGARLVTVLLRLWVFPPTGVGLCNFPRQLKPPWNWQETYLRSQIYLKKNGCSMWKLQLAKVHSHNYLDFYSRKFFNFANVGSAFCNVPKHIF